jgi:hypothetical protein
MSPPPAVKLSVLRDIGWREWDPIGLRTLEGGWEGSSAADEYDRYLLHLAARLQKGEADGPLVDYLVHIETEHMGLSPNASVRPRAATVGAVREYVRNLT